jgi:hypothetical protein
LHTHAQGTFKTSFLLTSTEQQRQSPESIGPHGSIGSFRSNFRNQGRVKFYQESRTIDPANEDVVITFDDDDDNDDVLVT